MVFVGGTTPVLRAGTAPAHAGFPAQRVRRPKGKAHQYNPGQGCPKFHCARLYQRAGHNQIPGNGVKTFRAVAAAAGNKQTGTHARAVGNITVFYGCVVHAGSLLIKCNTISCIVLRQIITIGRCLAPVYQPCRAKASGQGTIKSHIIAALKKVPILPKKPALFSAFCFEIFFERPIALYGIYGCY